MRQHSRRGSGHGHGARDSASRKTLVFHNNTERESVSREIAAGRHLSLQANRSIRRAYSPLPTLKTVAGWMCESV